jgi:hypothetical protein
MSPAEARVECELKDEQLYVAGIEEPFVKQRAIKTGNSLLDTLQGHLFELAVTELYQVREHSLSMPESDDLRPNSQHTLLQGNGIVRGKFAIIGASRPASNEFTVYVRPFDDDPDGKGTPFARKSWPASIYGPTPYWFAADRGWEITIMLPRPLYDELALCCASRRLGRLEIDLHADMWLPKSVAERYYIDSPRWTLYLRPDSNGNPDRPEHANALVRRLCWHERPTELKNPWVQVEAEPSTADKVCRSLDAIQGDLTAWRADLRWSIGIILSALIAILFRVWTRL